jgi:hypothetical protein
MRAAALLVACHIVRDLAAAGGNRVAVWTSLIALWLALGIAFADLVKWLNDG